jgi:acyl-CoA thioester hydrolase
MIELPFRDFVDRVFVSHERVRFAEADPYGHLSSGAHVDLVLNHRVQVLADVAGIDLVRAVGGLAFPVSSLNVTYRRPSFVGDRLRLGSWVEEIGDDRFQVRVVIAGEENGKVRATAVAVFAVVDTRTGRAVAVPTSLASSLDANPLADLPIAADYMRVTGVPAGASRTPLS